MALGTYDPSQVALVAVVVPVSGFAEGTFITAERNEDSFNLSVGSDGESCRTRSNNKSGRITFVLQQSAAVNVLLSAVINADEITPSGDSIAPSTVTDTTGTTIIFAENSWFVRPANVEYSNETSTREWIIETDNLVMNIGGN